MRLTGRMALSMEKHAATQPTPHPGDLAETLVSQYFAYLQRLAQSILEDSAEASDAAQETLLRALAHWDDSRERTQLRGWLSLLAINICRDRLRRRKSRNRMQNALQAIQRLNPSAPSVEQLVQRRQSHNELWNAVQELDEKHRLPLILRFVHGLLAPEIAAALGISEGTVYSRLHYAIRKLQERLGPAFREGGFE